jgi:Domain of unknown function (DUF5615)
MMSPIRVYLDEDVHPFVAHALRLRGWGAATTFQLGRQQCTDADQIPYATQNGYSILTYNVRDFPRLHHEILAGGGNHSGILVATQDDPRRTIRALLNLIALFSADDLHNQLLYVNNWG